MGDQPGRARRSAAVVALATAVATLAVPAAALARGGGGSGRFGGGGGGGFGGGGRGGGSGFGPGRGGGGAALFIPVWGWGVIVGIWVLGFLVAAIRRRLDQRRRDGRQPLDLRWLLSTAPLLVRWPWELLREALSYRRRARRTERAAAEAAEDDPLFDAETVRAAGRELFGEVQEAWSRDDRDRLAELASEPLMAEWYRRLSDFSMRGWTNEVRVLGELRVDYVGLVNRADDIDDAATVRIVARLSDRVVDSDGNVVRRRGALTDRDRVCEYWTLGKRDGRWIVARIEQHLEGMHALREPLVPTPWADDERLRAQAEVERAVEEAIPDAELPAIAPPTLDADLRTAALDLALVDGRFSPDLLVSEVRHAVGAWVSAIDGDDAQLERIADPDAVTALLYGDDASHRTRLVVRGLQVDDVRIVELDPAAVPPRLTVELHARGAAYAEDRATWTVVSGSRSSRRALTQRWQLELSGDGEHPWRLVGAGAPATT
jgi:predicted lipid-binding transport protein (Tim44 family)